MVTLGNTLSVSSLATLSSGCVFNNPTGITTGLGTTLNYYKQGVSWTYTLTAGSASTTVTFTATRIGNVVILKTNGWTLSSNSANYILTGLTNVMSGYPYGTLPGALYSTVICTTNGTQTLTIAEITTDNTLNIYPATNLTGNFAKIVVMPQYVWTFDLS